MMRDFLYYMHLVFEAAAGVFGIRPYEEPSYAVDDRLTGGIEVRRYEARLAAEVLLAEAEGRAGANRAFSLLFDYIAGNNRGADAEEKIAMTVPVEVASRNEKIAMTVPVESVRSASGTRMRFYLPSRYTLESAPRPLDPRVRLIDAPSEMLAVLRFSGAPDEREIAARQRSLIEALAGSGWRPAADPVTLFYDAPFTLPFLRRNEVAVAVLRK